jgi:predicted nucleic acid-binding Zn ribbon protein
MSTVYIGSVCPIPLKVTRPLYGGNYVFKPVARGEKPFVMEVTDKVQIERELVTHREMRRTILGEDIANDILREINEACLGEGDMGVWLIGPTPEHTPEQVRDATLRLRQKLNWLVSDTDAWSPERRSKFIANIGIPPIRKMAVQYLGLERDWATMTPDQMTNCPHCKKAVKIDASTCEHCDGIINYDKWAENEAKKAAALAKYMPPPQSPPPAQPQSNQQNARR